ncbi:MAG: hypothetical protein QME05_03525, partial [Candidatus Margulisbacteria bacterium]|nr:hypothetical protein [Candidatus Margulisiibacteriota bacterium]
MIPMLNKLALKTGFYRQAVKAERVGPNQVTLYGVTKRWFGFGREVCGMQFGGGIPTTQNIPVVTQKAHIEGIADRTGTIRVNSKKRYLGFYTNGTAELALSLHAFARTTLEPWKNDANIGTEVRAFLALIPAPPAPPAPPSAGSDETAARLEVARTATAAIVDTATNDTLPPALIAIKLRQWWEPLSNLTIQQALPHISRGV